MPSPLLTYIPILYKVALIVPELISSTVETKFIRNINWLLEATLMERIRKRKREGLNNTSK